MIDRKPSERISARAQCGMPKGFARKEHPEMYEKKESSRKKLKTDGEAEAEEEDQEPNPSCGIPEESDKVDPNFFINKPHHADHYVDQLAHVFMKFACDHVNMKAPELLRVMATNICRTGKIKGLFVRLEVLQYLDPTASKNNQGTIVYYLLSETDAHDKFPYFEEKLKVFREKIAALLPSPKKETSDPLTSEELKGLSRNNWEIIGETLITKVKYVRLRPWGSLGEGKYGFDSREELRRHMGKIRLVALSTLQADVRWKDEYENYLKPEDLDSWDPEEIIEGGLTKEHMGQYKVKFVNSEKPLWTTPAEIPWIWHSKWHELMKSYYRKEQPKLDRTTTMEGTQELTPNGDD